MSTKNEYETFLATLRKETGLDALVADESGLVSVRVDDSYNVNLQFVEATGKILRFSHSSIRATYTPRTMTP